MLHNLTHEITLWLHQNPEWGGIITFIVALSESLAIIGFFVPALIFFTTIGALVSAGVLPLTPILLWAFAGAVAGDGISYIIGYYFRDTLQRVWPFNKYQKLLNKGKAYFAEHGGKSVFISRFIGPLRSLIPMVAGIMHMKPQKFFLVNIPSAVIWSPFYMSGGFLLGLAAQSLSPHSGQHLTVVLSMTLLIMAVAFFILRWLIGIVHKRLHGKLMRFKSVQQFFFNAIDFNHAQQTFLGLWGIVCLILLCIVLLLIIGHVGIDAINIDVYQFFQNDRNPTGDKFFLFITLLGQPQILLPWFLSVAAYLFLIKKNWRAVKYFVMLILVAIATTYLFRTLTHYPTPNFTSTNLSDFSFPSSHLIFSTCTYGFLAYLISKEFEQQYRQWFFYLTSILVLAIGISRLYFGIHWLTDIVGSTLMGLVLVLISIILYRRKPIETIKLGWFIPIVLFSLAVIYSTYTWFNYDTFLNSYQFLPPQAVSVMMPGPVLV